ncbi:MAG: hypothetical protein WAN36_09720, partial [Calditrichia bacterium]
IKLAENKKFKAQDIFPVHIHGVLPRLGKVHRELHAEISNRLQDYAEKAFMLLPHASTFMIHFVKE